MKAQYFTGLETIKGKKFYVQISCPKSINGHYYKGMKCVFCKKKIMGAIIEK